ncbi:MAG: deaminase [Sphingobacteriales bacterium]|nr:MAG: deaminase [Sphingobacteriales bacterium]
MRKLKLQMTTTIDGYVAGPNHEMDWFMDIKPGEITPLVYELIDSSDTILLGRKMIPSFTSYWEGVVDNPPESPEHSFAQRMVNTNKVVFSKTVQSLPGKNLRVENGDLVDVINKMKSEPGKDLLAYGGASFVSSLIENDLVDEYYLLVYPVAIGKGLPIFSGKTKLNLVSSEKIVNGILINKYTRA